MDNQKKNPNEDDPRLQQAGEWLMRLRQDDVSSEQLNAWLDWCRRDARNPQAFERVRDLALGLGEIEAGERAAIVEECLAEQGAPQKPGQHRAARAYAALAAGIAISVVTLIYYVYQQQFHDKQFQATYATATARNQKYSLPDGTRVELAAGSKIRINYTFAARRVLLRRGEAYFRVKHNAHRPFVVRSGKLRVEDVGTAFDVRNSDHRTLVSVADGVVNVSHAETRDASTRSAAAARRPPAADWVHLTAGHKVSTNPTQPELTVTKIDTDAVASWRHGRLKFQNTPLSNVIANINRYSEHTIIIADPAVGKMRFTGTVFENQIPAWLAATKQVFSLRQERGQQGRVLLYAKKHPR